MRVVVALLCLSVVCWGAPSSDPLPRYLDLQFEQTPRKFSTQLDVSTQRCFFRIFFFSTIAIQQQFATIQQFFIILFL